MNIFAILFVLAILATISVTLLISAVLAYKRRWKALWWTLGGCAILLGLEFGVMAFWFSCMDQRLHRRVADSEVIGRWVLEDASLEMTKNDHFYPYRPAEKSIHSIDIRSDHSCTYSSILGYPPHFRRMDGTWLIRSAEGDIEVSELALSLNDSSGGWSTSMQFGDFDHHLAVWDYFGDPDSCNLLVYRKEPNQALLPTPTSVTPRACARVAPDVGVADL